MRLLQTTMVALLPVIVLVVSGCGIDPMERLNEEIESEDIEVRRSALLRLANLDDQRTVVALTEVFEDHDELMGMAATALVKKGREQKTERKPDPIIEGIAAIVNNVHMAEPVRARAAWILGEIGDREAIPALKTAAAGKLNSGAAAELLRAEAGEALEKLGYKETGRPFEMPVGTLADQELMTIPEPEPMETEAEETTA